jgi:hypothetical protein
MNKKERVWKDSRRVGAKREKKYLGEVRDTLFLEEERV